MQQIFDFLSQNPMLGICICLAFGYLIGAVKIKGFSLGATIGTLLVGFLLSRFVTFEIPGILVSVFLLLFCFAIGYEAGPAFFESLRSNGIKFVIQAVFFAVSAFAVLYLIGLFDLFDRDTLIGMAAGALTQTSILTVVDGLGDMASISYAVTYMTGTLLPIVFVASVLPKLIRTTPIMAAKQKLSHIKSAPTVKDTEDARLAPVFPRAYRVEAGAGCIGQSIEALEARFDHSLEVVKLFRSGKEVEISQALLVQEGDVLTVISAIKHMILLDDESMSEVSEPEYLSLKVVTKEIVITEASDAPLFDLLSEFGVVLHTVVSKQGKRLRATAGVTPVRGMVIKVSGIEASVKKIANALGYIKEIGSATDVPFVFFSLALAILFGSLKFFGFSLGDSTCALIIGLVCGWFCNKNPKYGKFPESTRWFIKNVGLNLFIACKALTTGLFAFDSKMLMIFGVGALVTLLPHILTLFFSRFVLKMDDADNLGGLCGSGTCTPALNALIDSAGSGVFTASYATTNAVANILLTVLGLLLGAVL